MEVYENIISRLHQRYFSNNSHIITEALQNTGLFQSEARHLLESHVKHINILLSHKKTGEDGIKLLLALVPQCPLVVLTKQGERWLRFCAQVINSGYCARAKIDACQSMIIILKGLPNLPELQRTVLSKPAAPLVTDLAAADSLWNCAALECLYEYLKVSPGQCLPHKTVLEEHILGYLDNPLTRVGQSDAVSRAGKVFAALPLPGMGGSGAQGRAEARGRQLTQLLAVAHSLMDYLFDGIVERESYRHTREYTIHLAPLESLGEISTDPLQTRLAAVTRLVNSLKFIAEMITADVNESVTIAPHDLLGVIFRLLQADIRTLSKYLSQEHKMLTFLMPSLHQHCLLLLRDVLLSIGESVDMYFGVIANLLLSTIKTTTIDNQPEWCTSGQQTRIIAYSVMSTVVEVSCGRHQPNPYLVTLILDDVIPKAQRVTLQNKQNKGLASLSLSKKKSKKKGYSVTVADCGTNTNPLPYLECFSRVARVALSLIEALFTYATHSMTQKIQQLLQTSVMSVAAAVTGVTTIPITYKDGKTRAQLYKTLGSIATHPHPGCPPSYTMIVHLLQKGHQDSDTLVASTCQAALGSVSFIMANPKICSLMHTMKGPSHHNTGEEDEEENLIQEDENIISPEEKKGKDRVSEDQTEEEEDKVEEEIEDIDKDDMVEEEDAAENGEEIEKILEEEKEDTDKEDMVEETEAAEDMVDEQVALEKDMAGSINKTHDGDEGSQDSAPTDERTIAQHLPSRKKPKLSHNEEPVIGPTLDEMLADFVDCGPDD